jgi:hypothetical protein
MAGNVWYYCPTESLPQKQTGSKEHLWVNTCSQQLLKDAAPVTASTTVQNQSRLAVAVAYRFLFDSYANRKKILENSQVIRGLHLRGLRDTAGRKRGVYKD